MIVISVRLKVLSGPSMIVITVTNQVLSGPSIKQSFQDHLSDSSFRTIYDVK